MSTQEVNDFLMSGGRPSAKFPTVGATVRGTVVDATVEQQRDFQSGELKFWKDGKPMNQAVVTVQTDERDPDIEDDDGQRRLFVRGQMQAAVRDAVRKSGAGRLEVGGTLVVKYIRDEPAKTRGFNPSKVYEAAYKPPASTGVDEFLGDSQPQPATAGAAAGPSASDLL